MVRFLQNLPHFNGGIYFIIIFISYNKPVGDVDLHSALSPSSCTVLSMAPPVECLGEPV